MKYPLASDTWNEEEIEAINEVVASGKYTLGSKVNQFEESFAKYHNKKYAVMTNSGSSANLLMLSAFHHHEDYPEKGNIIVPGVSWSTTYFPVSQLGYKLKFVDINNQTFNLDEDLVEEAIDEETVAIFAVNLLGNCCNLEKLLELSKKAKISLFEDNCESLGSRFNERLSGTFGLMSSFSFFFSHHLQTMEGGMVLTDSQELADYLKSLRAHGWIRDLEVNNSIYQKTGSKFHDSFKFVLPGYCLRPLEMSGAVGKVQLKKWPEMLKIRRENASYFQKKIKEVDHLVLQKEVGESSWFGFGLVCEDIISDKRDAIVNYLESNGIECRPIVAGNFTNNPVINRLDHEIYKELANSEIIDRSGFFIGNDSRPLNKEIDFFVKTVNDCLK